MQVVSQPGPFDSDGDPFQQMADMFGRFAQSFGGTQGLNYEQARQMAGQIANDGQPESNVDPTERIRLEQFARVAELHVSKTTGLRVTPGLDVEPVNRSQWASASLDAYRPMFERLTDSLGSMMRRQLEEIDPEDLTDEDSPLSAMTGGNPEAFIAGMSQLLGPMMLSMMAGSTIGHLARRAFGAYDLPIPRPADELMLVVSTAEQFADDWSLPRDDLYLWICLSEVTHQAVLGIPHVRQRITDLLAGHAGGFNSDTGELESRLAELDLADPTSMEELQKLVGDPDVVLGAMRSDAQREILVELDVIVAAVEGYVDHVIDEISATLIGSGSMVAEAIRRRRVETDQATRFIERLFGLELTQDKLDRGSAFIAGVAERAGADQLHRLWESPESLPTANELDAPGLWVARMGIDADQPLPELDEPPDIPDFPNLDT